MTQSNTDSLTQWMKESADSLDTYYRKNHIRLYYSDFRYGRRSINNSFVFEGIKNNYF
jgi:hypothetical protein